MIHKDPNKILFVIVLYKCKLESSITYNTLLKDNVTPDDIFVYDNSPQKNYTDINVGKYISDTSNGGLSIAYNTAAAYAKENSYKWLMLLDQDTNFPKGALGEYIDFMKINNSIHLIAPQHCINDEWYISPTKYKNFKSHMQREVQTGIVDFKNARPINSGIMITTESFLRVGGYDNKIKLDFSDVRFFEKYAIYYQYFYVLPSIRCLQNYSGVELNKQKVLSRFEIYLSCAKAYPKKNVFVSLIFIYITFRRALELTKQYKTYKALFTYLSSYIINNKLWKTK